MVTALSSTTLQSGKSLNTTALKSMTADLTVSQRTEASAVLIYQNGMESPKMPAFSKRSSAPPMLNAGRQGPLSAGRGRSFRNNPSLRVARDVVTATHNLNGDAQLIRSLPPITP